mmetsp:Transcript_14493/g.27577  ORF Transcript_14493/g.27577 Transcript_14493/m.27577 type:complete len:239 (-) Transcript_14493:349-1065(-)|eukprot:scaffold1690_cov182-Amphora_coffeaeformis.AAC.15
MRMSLLSLLLLLLSSLPCLVRAGKYTEQGEKFLAEKEKELDVFKLNDSGFLYKVLEKGSGKFRVKDEHQKVKCSYVGYHMDYEAYPIFGDDEDQEMMPEEVMEGWKMALMNMVEGDRWEIYLPPKLAKEFGADITGEVFIFDMQLKEILGERKSIYGCSLTDDDKSFCSEREQQYIVTTETWDSDKIAEELERLTIVEQAGQIKGEQLEWFTQRSNILKQRQEEAAAGESSNPAGEEL